MDGQLYHFLIVVVGEVLAEVGFGHPGEVLEVFCGERWNSIYGNSLEEELIIPIPSFERFVLDSA